MNLSRDNLVITETKSNTYRVSYEPFDEFTPSFDGLIEVDLDISIEGDGINEPQFRYTIINGIEYKKLIVWYNEGYHEITDTELGQEFIKELEELILNELKG